MLYRDGIALARLLSGQIELLAPLAPADEHAVRKALLREPEPVPTPLQETQPQH